jgi:hypothetical protein
LNPKSSERKKRGLSRTFKQYRKLALRTQQKRWLSAGEREHRVDEHQGSEKLQTHWPCGQDGCANNNQSARKQLTDET